MSNVTVTCRCSRTMRQERGRPAGNLVCGCGNRVRINDQQHGLCHVRDKDGSPCTRPVVMTHPIALCHRHINQLVTTKPFLTRGVSEQQRTMWKLAEEEGTKEEQRIERMKQRRREVEEQLRQEALASQSVVYYIARGGIIKIGFTTNMTQRMASLMPDAILATEPGDRALEKRRHGQFKHLRAPLGNEYFSVHPDLLLHVETVLAEHGPPKMTGYPSYHSWHLGDHMLVPVKEAARLAGVPIRTMYEWIREGRLTVTRPGEKQRGALVNALEAQELAGLRKSGKLPRLDRAG